MDMLARFLALKEAGGAVGKAALESVPGLIRDNPAVAGGGALGLGAGAMLHKSLSPSEDDIRKDEDSSMLRRYLDMHGIGGI